MTRAFGAAVLFLLFLSVAAGAQAPAPPKPAPVPPTQPAAPAAAPAPTPTPTPTPTPAPTAPPAVSTEAYTYQADGRRDPFLNISGTGTETKAAVSRKGEGPSGLAVADLSVRGVIMSRGALVAMVEGPDKRTYIVHQGDKLLDGTIKSITPQGLVVEQVVNDPLSLVKRREIRKLLKTLEDTKG